MKVLITGMHGFLASRLHRYLAHDVDGHGDDLDLYGYDKHYSQDIRDYEQIKAATAGKDLVIHLAAMTHVDDSIFHPEPYFLANGLGTVNVLRACTELAVSLIHVSTSECYGEAVYAPQDEDHPMMPCSPYAAAKVAADRACFAWWRTYGTDVRIVRPFNQYGPGQTKQKLFPILVQKALAGEPLTVYGDGTQTRDYLWVDDTVRGIWDARRLPAGEVVNLCTGRELSVLEIANIIKAELASDSMVVKIEHGARRPGEVQRMCGSPAKAERLLGWRSAVTVEEGVRRLADWYSVNGPIAGHTKVELRTP